MAQITLNSTGVASNGTLALQSNGTTTAVTIDASQNVGIGVATPSAKLSVSDTADPKINLLVGTNERAFISYTTATTTASFDSDADITLSPNNTVAVRANAAGNLQFNSGYGSVATAYGCRAWVNFNGTGTVSIRASGNVSSITDNGTGWYTVNFTNAMPDANYAVSVSSEMGSGNGGFNGIAGTPSTTGVQIVAYTQTGASRDISFAYIAIFR